jgi:hypothetical protein
MMKITFGRLCCAIIGAASKVKNSRLCSMSANVH